MLAQARIDEMKNIDIRTVDRNTLPDMSNFKFDNTLSQEERAKRIYEASSNPYLFRLGDTVVKVEFAENGLSLQDLMGALLLRKSNLNSKQKITDQAVDESSPAMSKNIFLHVTVT